MLLVSHKVIFIENEAVVYTIRNYAGLTAFAATI